LFPLSCSLSLSLSLSVSLSRSLFLTLSAIVYWPRSRPQLCTSQCCNVRTFSLRSYTSSLRRCHFI
jgi:hypothetical protein